MPGGTPRIVGRYALFGEIAAGGMATVAFGRLLGEAGFSRTVAIKCLHSYFAKDPEFVAMFLDEARLAARIRHPNVVPTLDVTALEGELFLVMEYVQGEALSRLWKAARERHERIPPKVVASIMAGVLHGLHAAHEAKSERGVPLGIAHRDVSPQNILVGADGVPRVLDFGIAKASGRIQITREGRVKGKTGYMSPEQLTGGAIDRRTDIYSASVVLWEALTGERLFEADNEHAAADKIKNAIVRAPSDLASEIVPFDAVTLHGLARDPGARFATAKEMAIALERCQGIATPSEVAEWVERMAGAELERRARTIAEIEGVSSGASSLLGEATAGGHAPAHDMDPEGEAVTRLAGAPKVWTDEDHDAPTHARLAVGGAGASGVTEPATRVSMARPGDADERRAPERRILLALGLSAAAAALGALFLFASRGRPPSAVVASEPVPGAGEPATSLSASSVAASPSSTVLGTALLEAPSAPTATATPAATAASHAALHTPHPRPSCNPPYTVDLQGIRHIKRECL